MQPRPRQLSSEPILERALEHSLDAALPVIERGLVYTEAQLAFVAPQPHFRDSRPHVEARAKTRKSRAHARLVPARRPGSEPMRERVRLLAQPRSIGKAGAEEAIRRPRRVRIDTGQLGQKAMQRGRVALAID